MLACSLSPRRVARVAVVGATLLVAVQARSQESDWTLPNSSPDPWVTPQGSAGKPGKRTALNTLYFELLGSGVLGSFNYERIVADAVALRLGFGTYSGDVLSNTGNSWITFPLTASYLAGQGPHLLELGAGAVGMWTSGGGNILGNALVGYRYQRSTGGVVFRVTATPLILFTGNPKIVRCSNDLTVVAWLGASVGGAF